MFDLPLIVSEAGSSGNIAGANGVGMDGFSLYAALRNADIASGGVGAKLVSWPYDPRMPSVGAIGNMSNGRTMLVPQLVKGGLQIDGVSFVQNVIGNYTPVNSNQIGAYTYDGTQFTRVAVCVSDGNLWQGSGGMRNKAFTTPYTPAQDMLLWAAGLYNSSAAVTVPQILGNTVQDAGGKNLDLSNGFTMQTGDAGTPNLAATIANASITNSFTALFWLAFYHTY